MSNLTIHNNPKTQKKYRISEMLSIYSASQQAKLRNAICISCGIHRNTLSVWEGITKNEARMIPADHLAIVAELLSTSIENLLPKK